MKLALLVFFLPAMAWAQTNPSQGKGGGMSIFLPLMVTFVIFYVLLILPQQRREKEKQKKLSAIEKGDQVTTKGGIVGKVTNVAEQILTLEIAEKTRVKIDRAFVHAVSKDKAKSS